MTPTLGDRAPDDLERALLQACELIESTFAEHRRTSSHEILSTAPSEAAGDGAARELVARARYGLNVTIPRDSTVAAAVCAILAEGGHPLLHVRLLCVPQAVHRLAGFDGRTDCPRYEIRVSDGPLDDTVIVDGRLAVVRPCPAVGAGETSSIHVPAVAGALEMLFAAAWRNGVPLADHRMLGDRESVRRILTELCAGVTDEQAALHLDVSLRTYRRRVAEIMRWLGAGSRFQAGVRAAELGLLGPRRTI